ncbi:MAG: 30S ribosomal protein S4e [Candidatus Woesearchaeota archaeon]|nr:MAG: 30S ribosomal protein S4e [Candidatus Woesearchaeota archaeon]
MVQNHLSRLAVPRSWTIKQRKGIKFITRPKTGPHSLETSIPLIIVLREMLNQATTTREVKKILNDKKVLVDNKVRGDHKYPIGLMDTLSFPSINKYYRMLMNKRGKFYLKDISKEESLLKPYKISKKNIINGKKIQLTFFDGKTKIVNDNSYKVGDTIVINLENNEIKSHIKLQKGASVYLTNGRHIGTFHVVEEVKVSKDLQPNKITFKIDDKIVETPMNYAFPVDKKFVN